MIFGMVPGIGFELSDNAFGFAVACMIFCWGLRSLRYRHIEEMERIRVSGDYHDDDGDACHCDDCVAYARLIETEEAKRSGRTSDLEIDDRSEPSRN